MSLTVSNKILISGEQRILFDGFAGAEIQIDEGWYTPAELEAWFAIAIAGAPAGYVNILLEVENQCRFYRTGAGADFALTIWTGTALAGEQGGDLADYLGFMDHAAAAEHTSVTGSAVMEFGSSLAPWRWTRAYPGRSGMDWRGNSARPNSDAADRIQTSLWILPTDDHERAARVFNRALRSAFYIDHGDPTFFTWAAMDFTRRLACCFADPEYDFSDLVSGGWQTFKNLDLRLWVWTE